MSYLVGGNQERHSCLLYNNEVQRVLKEIEEASHVALTTNLWTSCQTKDFITVTAHFISAEWVLKSAVLDSVCIEGSHTAENIAQHLTMICNKWNIFHKVRSIITNNAANISAALIKQTSTPMTFTHLESSRTRCNKKY